MGYEVQGQGNNGVRISTRETSGGLANFVNNMVVAFYQGQEFYKVPIEVQIPRFPDFDGLAMGESIKLTPYDLIAKPEGENPINAGKVGVTYFKGGKERRRRGVDYPASDVFATEETPTYHALTLWFNTRSPFPSSAQIRDTREEEDTLRRGLERDAFLAFLEARNV